MHATERLPVFVYGTLRSGQGNWSWALAGRTLTEQRGTLTGARMHDNHGFPFVLRSTDPGDTVVGEVMTVADADYTDVLRSLDGLEGYYGPDSTTNMYDRVIVEITLDTGETVRAYTYLTGASLVDRVTATMPRIDSGDWVAHDTNRPTTSAWYDQDETAPYADEFAGEFADDGYDTTPTTV